MRRRPETLSFLKRMNREMRALEVISVLLFSGLFASVLGISRDPEQINVTLCCVKICSSEQCEYRVPLDVLNRHHTGPDSGQQWEHDGRLVALHPNEGGRNFVEPVTNVSHGILITRHCLDNITMQPPYDSNQTYKVYFKASNGSLPASDNSSGVSGPQITGFVIGVVTVVGAMTGFGLCWFCKGQKKRRHYNTSNNAADQQTEMDNI